MKLLLNGLLIFIMIYLLFDIFVKSHTPGLSVHAVSTTLFGNADEFLDPMNKSVFLEFIHMQIFFLMMLLLTLSAVFIRLLHKKTNTILNVFAFGLLLMVLLHFLIFTNKRDTKEMQIIIYASFIATFLELFSPFLIIAGVDFFIYIKLIAYFLFNFTVLYALFILIKSIIYD